MKAKPEIVIGIIIILLLIINIAFNIVTFYFSYPNPLNEDTFFGKLWESGIYGDKSTQLGLKYLTCGLFEGQKTMGRISELLSEISKIDFPTETNELRKKAELYDTLDSICAKYNAIFPESGRLLKVPQAPVE